MQVTRGATLRVGALTHAAAIGLALVVLAGPAWSRARVGEVAAVRIETAHPYPAGTQERPVVWSHTLRHAGATLLKVHFARFAVAGEFANGSVVGDYVRVLDATGKEQERLTGVFAEDVWAASVQGDTVTIELHADQAGTADGIVIDGYGYGTALVGSGVGAGAPAPFSVCGSNDRRPICAAIVAERIRLSDPVARVMIAGDCGGLFLCTGFLFGTDGKFMTNAHCANSGREAHSMELWFNYVDDAGTSGPCSRSDRPNPDVFQGSSLLAEDCRLDAAVLRIRDRVKGNPAEVYGFLDLSSRAPVAGEQIWVPQHTGGLEKTLTEVDAIVSVAAWEGLDVCRDPGADCVAEDTATGSMTEFGHTADTGSGSSGSPVVDEHNQVIGLHHASGCGQAPGTNSAVRMAAILPLVARIPSLDVKRLAIRKTSSAMLNMRAGLETAGENDLAPSTDPVRLLLKDSGGVIFDQTIPPGSFAEGTGGARWSFRDPEGTVAGGITKMAFATRNGQNYKVKAKAQNIDAASADEPTLDVTIEVGDQTFSAPALPCMDRARSKLCRPQRGFTR